MSYQFTMNNLPHLPHASQAQMLQVPIQPATTCHNLQPALQVALQVDEMERCRCADNLQHLKLNWALQVWQVIRPFFFWR